MNVKIVEGIDENLSSLLNTVDGSKVYYAYEGLLEKYKEKFEGYQEGQNKLPDSLKNIALELTYSTLIDTEDTLVLWIQLGHILDSISRELFEATIDGVDVLGIQEYFNKYNNIKEVK